MRRRMLRRAGRTLRGNEVAAIPPLLLRSTQLLGVGDFARAAEGFEQLARATEGRRNRRAAHMYLEAGRARILGGEVDAGMSLLDHGLRILANSAAAIQLPRAAARVIAELSARGLNTQADQIRSSLANMGFPTAESLADSVHSESRPLLPVRCTGCGAPVRPDELEWVDDATAECAYCGTLMRPE